MKRLLPIIGAISLLAAACGGSSPYREQALSGNVLPEAVYFIIDTSDSMNDSVAVLGGGSDSKISVAKRALGDLVTELAGSVDLGLRSYPDPFLNYCNEGLLLQRLGPTSASQIREEVNGLVARSGTPTAEALEAAAADIRSYGEPTTVVLLSDGLSGCADPCMAARNLSSSTDWSVITIGFDLGSEGSSELRCIAQATGGQYVNASDGAELEALFSDPDRLFSVTG